MKWVPADIEMYLQAAEYVDTAIIPLLPIDLEDGMKDSATKTEFATLLSGFLERQFRGRVILMPGIPYQKGMEDNVLPQLEEWNKSLGKVSLRHVFFITSDLAWKQREDKIGGNLLWVPSLPLQQMDERSKTAALEDQAAQLMSLFAQKWEESDTV
ncbi:YpiF family protein [Bacillus massilinigeriensis]|uniref:YpiF family protein n=1 Tax=Bacillus mediterraneensis TaxID=1805474 RepID=UPI0008F863B3|nr:YpiF family protein [Bacillus mediterraneensis]